MDELGMRFPGIDAGQRLAPALEGLLLQRRRREPEPMPARERLSEGLIALVLLAAVVAIDGGFPEARRSLDLGQAAAYTVAYALACRVRFHVGAGYMTPLQLVLVPMLFVLPVATVPLFVALGFTLARVPDWIAGRAHGDRGLAAFADAWHAVGPALVFAAAGITHPDWHDGPWYVAAFGAQVLTDVVASTTREWAALGVSPRIQLPVLARIYMVDALLAPIGLLAAFAADGQPYRGLLVLPLLALIAVFAQEREQHIESTLELSNAYRGTALLLGDVLEDKDAYTASHSQGVVGLSLAVADRMRLDPAARRRVEFGALLHDIGKIAVPAEIINKPGPLDAEEWAIMKLHTLEGQHLLDRVGGVLGEVGRVVRSSHEYFDGSGYPDGLAGDEIPIESRIIACCDALSAMTTTRSYRVALSVHMARNELIRNAGTQFDPRVVAALLDVLRDDGTVAAPAPLIVQEAPVPA
jgi:HD-GYP domain-containing protein (c-di-GMP phosphodiesterase class II)